MPSIEMSKSWHRRPSANLALRAFGLLLLFTAWLAGTALVMHGHAARAEAADYALALVAFVGASAGAASTLLGAHLFDRVPIASRWGQAPTLAIANPRRTAGRKAARP